MNGFDDSPINKLLHKKLNKLTSTSVYIKTSSIPIPVDPIDKPFRSLTFFDNFSYVVANILKSVVKISFKSSNSNQNHFVNNKDVITL